MENTLILKTGVKTEILGGSLVIALIVAGLFISLYFFGAPTPEMLLQGFLG